MTIIITTAFIYISYSANVTLMQNGQGTDMKAGLKQLEQPNSSTATTAPTKGVSTARTSPKIYGNVTRRDHL